MARYRHVDSSPRLLPVDLQAQLVPGSFAHAVHHLIDQVDLSAFYALYRNDEDGAPALPPAVLLKAVLLGYSQSLISSRAIERACRDNVLFVAVTGDAKPHFTTIAAFIRRSAEAISRLFGEVLTVLDGAGLISRDMFAVDGVKLPSNASKHRSGTRADFVARAGQLERRIGGMPQQHGSIAQGFRRQLQAECSIAGNWACLRMHTPGRVRSFSPDQTRCGHRPPVTASTNSPAAGLRHRLELNGASSTNRNRWQVGP